MKYMIWFHVFFEEFITSYFKTILN